MKAGAVHSVLGRERELMLLSEFLRAGAGAAAVVLTGGPGIGKTTIWEAGVDTARGCGYRVLRARSSGADARLAFAGLIDVFDGIDLDDLSLAAPQRYALAVALLREPPNAGAPEERAIALGALNALRDLPRPVLVAVDDVQWLDPPSAAALSFAARRVAAPGVRFLLTRRTGPRSPLELALSRGGLQRIAVGPLNLAATRRLLAERLDLTLSRHLLRRINDVTLGNPLFTLEIGHVLLERGVPELEDDLPVPESVEQLLGTRVARLPAALRRVLLAVALSGGISVEDLTAIAGGAAVDEALDRGLLRPEGDHLGPAHPLLGAAARKRSRVRERRALHRELAAVATDEERRAHHLALAATAPDENVAATVMAAASRAAARGARQEAVRLGEHALQLTAPDSPTRAERLLTLATSMESAGEPQRITDLITPALPSIPAGPLRARAWLLLAEGAHVQTLQDFRNHLDHALAEARDDRVLRAYVRASTSSAVIGVERIGEAEAQAREAFADARGDADVERTVLFALAWARALQGHAIDDICARFDKASPTPAHLSHSPRRVAGQRLVWRGRLQAARTFLTRLLALADERGEAGSYAFFRLHLCELALRAGAWAEASRLLEEWRDSAEREFLLPPMYERALSLLAAGRGVADEAERWAAEAIARAQQMGIQWDELEASRARGIARLAAHDPAGALVALRPVWEHTEREGVEEPGVFPVAPELVEALAEAGELAEARVVTKRLDTLAERLAHPWGRVTARRCGALVRLSEGAYDEAAAVELASASDAYDVLGLRFDSARSRLSLGRLQRRNRKWAAARETLARAGDTFDRLGSHGWAHAARAECARVGARRPAASGGLTPSETRVVELAAQGRANKEIASELHITVHTVEAHLRHAYSKLGVRSRAQLAHLVHAPKDHGSP